MKKIKADLNIQKQKDHDYFQQYYAKNKEKIAQKRKLKREQEKAQQVSYCAVCGKPFNKKGNAKYCSEECREIARKLIMANYKNSEHAREVMKAYRETKTYKKARAKYVGSEKWKLSQLKYAKSEKGKEARARYFQSEKGKEALKRYRDKLKAKKNEGLQ